MVGAISEGGAAVTGATYQSGTASVIAPDVAAKATGSGARVSILEDGTTGDISTASLTKPGLDYVATNIIQIMGGANSDGTGAVAHDVQITNGGTGHAVDDVLTIAGGTGTALKLKVIEVAAGVITKVAVNSTDHGDDYTVGDEVTCTSASASTGSGIDAKFKVTTVFGGGTFAAPTANTSFAMTTITGNGSGGRCTLSAADGGTPAVIDQGIGYRVGDLFSIAGGNTFVGDILTVQG
jgi:hypothetical protein